MGNYSDSLFSKNRRFYTARRDTTRMVIAQKQAPATPDPSRKGQYGGNCNITRCQKPGAFAWSLNNHAYYCDACAKMLNDEPSNRTYWKGRYGMDRFVFRIDSLTDVEKALLRNSTAYVPGITP